MRSNNNQWKWSRHGPRSRETQPNFYRNSFNTILVRSLFSVGLNPEHLQTSLKIIMDLIISGNPSWQTLHFCKKVEKLSKQGYFKSRNFRLSKKRKIFDKNFRIWQFLEQISLFWKISVILRKINSRFSDLNFRKHKLSRKMTKKREKRESFCPNNGEWRGARKSLVCMKYSVTQFVSKRGCRKKLPRRTCSNFYKRFKTNVNTEHNVS